MDKFFLVFLLSLLIAAHGVSGNVLCDQIGKQDEFESLDIEEEENEVELSEIPSWNSERGAKVLVNVDSFGAVGNGESDDTQVRFFFSLPFLVVLLKCICNSRYEYSIILSSHALYIYIHC